MRGHRSQKLKKNIQRVFIVSFSTLFFVCIVFFSFNATNRRSADGNGSDGNGIKAVDGRRRIRRGTRRDQRRMRACDDDDDDDDLILLEKFKKEWLRIDSNRNNFESNRVDDDSADVRYEKKTIFKGEFKGPLTLYQQIGKIPKVPKSTGEMEDLGILSKIDMKTLPESDALRVLIERKFRTCAIVGNGGSLLLYKHGSLIDAHDAVFRFNDGTGKKPYTKYAGSKTTVRLVNSQHRGYRESDEEIVLQHLTAPAHLKLYVSNRKQKMQHEKDYALSGAFYSFVKNKIGKSTPTNGMYGLYLAQSVCEKITIFGFARQWYNSTRYHYHNDYEPTGSQNARDSAEMIPLEKLVRSKPTKVMFGEPCVGGYNDDDDDDDKNCLLCPNGSRCEATTWFPVPDNGHKSNSKEKVCLFPARSVEGPAKYGTVDSKQRCYEQPRVDCFLPK